MDVCSGGTINAGATSITFTNNNSNTSYTITSCTGSNGQTMPGWPPNPPPVPAAQNGKAGSCIVVLTVAAVRGDYTYTPSPVCPLNTPPKIKVQ